MEVELLDVPPVLRSGEDRMSHGMGGELMADELPVPVHFRVAQQGIANSCAGRKSDVLFGWLHRPRGRFHGRTGVILCDPFGSEQNSIYRCYRQLAERLSSEGLWVMRFDYYGTGNS